ncbi:DUF4232 domain-containing protein [Streptomyces sp. NPDC051907]|uniref:DUF4232 domain-containing protein n=1 Tax=Streptomyces sp. NPDC051907 TaxID=3155284 RepID=UPI00342FF41D
MAAGGIVLLSLLTACGADGNGPGSPEKLPGAAQPAAGDPTSAAAGAATPAPASSTPAARPSASDGDGDGASSTRCHTSELRASIGENDPGAGRQNFPIVLTNRSGRTCTLVGYPGAAFVDASGKQLGADPQRGSGQALKVSLAPGKSARSALSFSNPRISGARTATPASVLVTPPDERDPLTVEWSGGEVPTSGDSSEVSVAVVSADG